MARERPTLFWAVIQRGWTSERGFAVMRVTSENKIVMFGTVNGITSRILKRDMKGLRFTDEAQAKLALDEVKKLWDAHTAFIEKAKSHMKQLETNRDLAINSLFIGKVEATGNVVPFSNR